MISVRRGFGNVLLSGAVCPRVETFVKPYIVAGKRLLVSVVGQSGPHDVFITVPMLEGKNIVLMLCIDPLWGEFNIISWCFHQPAGWVPLSGCYSRWRELQ